MSYTSCLIFPFRNVRNPIDDLFQCGQFLNNQFLSHKIHTCSEDRMDTGNNLKTVSYQDHKLASNAVAVLHSTSSIG